MKIENLQRIEAMIVQAILGGPALVQYRAGDISAAVLRPWAIKIRQMAESYTGERGGKNNPRPEVSAEAYCLYYLIPNVERLSAVLSHIPTTFFERELHVLDYGCGPGTAALTLIEGQRGYPLTIVGVDSSSRMLQLAQKIVPSLAPGSAQVTWQGASSLAAAGAKKFDLIILANVINEVPTSELHSLLSSIADRLAEGGVIVLLEPAMFEATRSLMTARDALLRKFARLSPIYPCTHRQDCPMLRLSTQDWCHNCIDWERPKLLRQLDELTGFTKHRLKYSAVVLGLGAALKDGLRVVTIPDRNKHSWWATVCGEGVYGDAVLEKRKVSVDNSCFKKVELHDHIQIENMEEGRKIGSSSVVRVIPQYSCK